MRSGNVGILPRSEPSRSSEPLASGLRLPEFTWPSPWAPVAIAAFLLAYMGLDQIDHIGPTRAWAIAPWNPELGLCIAAVLRWRWRFLPVIFLAPIIDAVVLADRDDGIWTAAITVIQTWTIVMAADALTARMRFLLKNELAAVLLASLPCALIGAGLGAVRLGFSGELAPQESAVAIARLWISGVIGIFIITPLFHLRLPEALRKISLRQGFEIAGQIAAMSLAVWFAFGAFPQLTARAFYAVFPPMIWIGLRFGLRGVIVTNAFVQASMIIALSMPGNENQDVTIFQALLLVLASSSLTLGMVVDQNRTATAQLHAREEELAASLKIAASGELAGTLAHELGHPIGAISNYAAALNHVIREVAPQASEALRIGAKLTQEIVRATDTLHRMRDFFRSGSMSFEPIDLAVLTKDAVLLLMERLARNGISPNLSAPHGRIVVLADQIQLRAVIYNLLVNAIDALKPVPAERRHLAVTLRRGGANAVLEIEDAGGGVAADVKEHIFEPLVTTKKDGLGLGLSMSRSVIAAHGGTIVLAESVLGGAKFVVTLPLEGA